MSYFFSSLGEFSEYSALVVRRIFSRRYTLDSLITQMHRIGVESLSVVNLCSFFIGLVLVVQTAAMLARFGAKSQVGMVVSASFVREIGPVFAAVMFTGRIGTGIAAELGSMVVTEQIDAYRVFGADPIGRLAVPRVLASTLMLPPIILIANLVGIFAGYLLARFHLNVSGDIYLDRSFEILTQTDLLGCVIKGVLFGLTVGLIATNVGLNTARATEAVGLSTTKTMVRGVVAILVLDLILAKILVAAQS